MRERLGSSRPCGRFRRALPYVLGGVIGVLYCLAVLAIRGVL